MYECHLIYTHMRSPDFTVVIFMKMTNDHFYYIQILFYRISPKWDKIPCSLHYMETLHTELNVNWSRNGEIIHRNSFTPIISIGLSLSQFHKNLTPALIVVTVYRRWMDEHECHLRHLPTNFQRSPNRGL